MVAFGSEAKRVLVGKKLRDVSEGFELQGIAGRVQEEHGGLLAYLTFKAGVRLDDEGDPGSAHARSEFFPFWRREDDAEVWDGNLMAVDQVSRGWNRGACGGELRGRLGPEVGDDLMAVKVEVNPLV